MHQQRAPWFLDGEAMGPAPNYEALRRRFVARLEAATRAHESGDLTAISMGYDQLDAELPRNAGPDFHKLDVALEFWDGWIDARNHDWLYYPGIAASDWPRLARGIVEDLEHNRDISMGAGRTMVHREPSKTAKGTARLRAAHQVLDDDPKILDDPVAVGLVPGSREDEIRAHAEEFQTPTLRAIRAILAMRSRHVEDVLKEVAAAGVGQ